MEMNKGTIVLMADLALDILAMIGLLYLFSQGYFSNLDGDALNKVFLRFGILGLLLAAVTIYLLVKKE